MFQVMGVFAEFERSMIVERVNAGLARARAEGKRLGRPSNLTEAGERRAREMLAEGISVVRVGKALGLGTGTVRRIKAAMDHRSS